MPNQLRINSRAVGNIKANNNCHGTIVGIIGDGRQRRYTIRWHHGQPAAPYTSNDLKIGGIQAVAIEANNQVLEAEETSSNDSDSFFEGLSRASEDCKSSSGSSDEDSRYKVARYS